MRLSPVCVAVCLLVSAAMVRFTFAAQTSSGEGNGTRAAMSSAQSVAAPLVEIPFEFEDNEIKLNVRLSRKAADKAKATSLKLLLDSGSPTTMVFSEAITRVKLDIGKPDDTAVETLMGVGDGEVNRKVSYYPGTVIGFGNSGSSQFETNLDGFVLDNVTEEDDCDGILGADLFEKFIVDIDYPNKLVRLYAPAALRIPVPGYTSVPLTVKDGEASVAVDITPYGFSKTSAHLQVDTGDAGPVGISLTREFNVKHEWARYLSSHRPTSSTGVGGDVKGSEGRLHSITLAKVTMVNPIAEFADNLAGGLSTSDYDGLLGNAILGRFEVIFDFGRGILFLKPGPNAADRFKTVYRYGADIAPPQSAGGDYTVAAIDPGGGFDQAGIRAGDILEKFDGRSLADVSREEFNRFIDGAPQSVAVTVLHKGETMPRDVVVHGVPF